MVQAILLASRAVSKRDVVVGNVVEEMNLFLLEHESSCNGVHRRVAPTLIEETTSVVQGSEVVDIGIGPEPIQIPNFEVGPEVAVVVRLAIVLADPFQRVAFDDVLGVDVCEILDRVPESRDGLDVFVQAKCKTVLLLVVGHELESVVVDIAVQLDAGLDTPVPFVVQHQGVTEKEA